jgi:hypothetical protein
MRPGNHQWRMDRDVPVLKTPLYVKTLHFKLEKDDSLTVRGMVTNRADFPAPPMRLSISLYDREDKMIARAGTSLPVMLPFKTENFELKFRPKDAAFFTVQFRLEKIKDVDYSDFNFAMHTWRAGPSGGLISGRKTK